MDFDHRDSKREITKQWKLVFFRQRVCKKTTGMSPVVVKKAKKATAIGHNSFKSFIFYTPLQKRIFLSYPKTGDTALSWV